MKDFEERLDAIEQSIKTIAEFVKGQIEEFRKNALTNEGLAQMEIKLREIEAAAKASEGSKIFKDHIKRIDELEAQIARITKLSDTKPIILAKFKQQMEDEMLHIKNDVQDAIRRLEERVESAEKNDLSELRVELEKLRNAAKEIDNLKSTLREHDSKLSKGPEFRSLYVLKSEIDEIKRSFHDVRMLEKQIKETREAMKELEGKFLPRDVKEISTLHAEINEIKKNIADIKPKENVRHEEIEDLIDDVNDIRHAIDEESANRISLEKAVQEINYRLKDMTGGQQNVDYEKIIESIKKDKKFIEEISQQSKMESLRLITKQREEFSKVMDRRLPNLVTKDDLVQMEKKLMQKQKMPVRIEEDTIGNRLAHLEANVSNLAALLRSMNYSGGPYVIE